MREGKRTDHIKAAYSPGEWTALVGEDLIADVDVYYGPDWNSTIRVEHKLEDVDEIEDIHQGGAGIVAFGGGASFRNVVVGDVNWDPGDSAPTKLLREMTYQPLSGPRSPWDTSDYLDKLRPSEDALRSWCPSLSVCARIPRKTIPLRAGD
eukprot:Polyplicarium_translucidae@DN2930_c0_g1_i4.p2